MGEQNVRIGTDSFMRRAFTRALLADLRALECLLDSELIETGVRRIGAEQEMFLIDSACEPAMSNLDVLDKIDDERFTTELGRFNLEVNLSPRTFGGDCLSQMESELREVVSTASDAAHKCGARVLLTGILPTLARSHLALDCMTPIPRYHQLNRTMAEVRGGDFHTLIKGYDELQLHHDNVMLEACNTSFQVHFQVGPKEFVRLYNIAQAVTAPVLSVAVNSPVLLQNRLWHETRIALFQQSIDVRSKTHQARGHRMRVSFGDHWVEDSVLEIFREDIARFRVLLASEQGPSSMELLESGAVPSLDALRLHNSTVYRWNRPCYGVVDGVAHLRIENRALPSGPTILDEVSNAAFFFGLMSALAEEDKDVTELMAWDDAESNFMAACRYGLKAQFKWFEGREWAASDLVLEELLPLARKGLEFQGIEVHDIDRYMGTIEERVKIGQTGSQWVLDSLAGMKAEGKTTREEQFRAVTAATWERQREKNPVHEWGLASLDESKDWRENFRRVGQVMRKDLFTVHPEDVVDLAACLMEWEYLRHVPVEDHEGHLVGVVSHRALLRLVGRGVSQRNVQPVAVEEVMNPSPVTCSPDTSCLEAIGLMRENRVGCLPVLEDGKLAGIVTERDFLDVAGRLLEEQLREP